MSAPLDESPFDLGYVDGGFAGGKHNPFQEGTPEHKEWEDGYELRQQGYSLEDHSFSVTP